MPDLERAPADTAPSSSEAELRHALRLAIWNGVTTQAMASLGSGVILVGLLLQMQASNLVIGMLAALPFLTQLFQIPGVFLVERLRARRPIYVYANGVGRASLFVIAAVAFITDETIAITLILAAVLMRLGLAGVSNSALNSWMRDLVPEAEMGAYYSRKLVYTTTVAALLTLAAGGFIDMWAAGFPKNRTAAYSILFVLAGIAGLIGVRVASRISEPAMVPVNKGEKLASKLLEPLRDTNFRNLIVFLGSWEFAVNLAAPFFTVYLLKRLGYPMSLVMVFTVISQLTNVAFFRIWGRLSDRYSNKSVLSVCGPLFILAIFGWSFVTFPDEHVLTIPLLVALHLLMGMSTAGVTLASNNIGLKLAPKGKATSYLATRAVVSSYAAGVAPIIGGVCADLLVDTQLSMSFRWESNGSEVVIPALIFKHWDFFFLLASVLGLYSLHRLSAVREEGEVEEAVLVEGLIAETRQTIGNLSTAAGLRAMSLFPIESVRDRNQREK